MVTIGHSRIKIPSRNKNASITFVIHYDLENFQLNGMDK
jgi:hypothetical protein